MALTSETSIIKKLGGVVLLVFGLLLTAMGYSNGSTGLAAIGILMLAAGVVLLVLKIIRRNQPHQL